MTVVELGAVRVDDGATQAQSQAGVEVKMAPKTEELALLRKRKAALERKWFVLHCTICAIKVTRGHNIVADEWAGAANLYPHPTPYPKQKHTQKASKRLFSHFSTRAHGPTEKRTNGQNP